MEAIAIARRRKMFVSESFQASKADKAIVIEKHPIRWIYTILTKTISFAPTISRVKDLIIESNKEQMQESASPYRYERLTELS